MRPLPRLHNNPFRVKLSDEQAAIEFARAHAKSVGYDLPGHGTAKYRA